MTSAEGEDVVHRQEWVGPLLAKLTVVALVIAGAWGIYRQIDSDDKVSKRHAQRITLVNTPPPRRTEPKPPEQEIKAEVSVEKLEVQTPQQADAPTDDALGVDEEGSAAGDSFGLAAKKGGRDIIMLGDQTENRPAAAARLGFDLYTSGLRAQLQDALNRKDQIRRGNYRVELRLWIGRAGEIERFEFVHGSGSKAMDDAIQLAMADLPRLGQPPPEMPQPVHISVTSREGL